MTDFHHPNTDNCGCSTAVHVVRVTIAYCDSSCNLVKMKMLIEWLSAIVRLLPVSPEGVTLTATDCTCI